jgi:4-aminobutyrate aminotransferase / (S)-3-amino-2-methylpropionate transaminase / 5-aminovalerate transaminase
MIMDAPDPGGIGGTYAGNAIACAAALGVFDAFEKEGLLEKAEKQGQIIMKRLQSIKAKGKGMPMGDVRGLGAMCAFELVTKHGGSEPDAGGAKALAAKCLERGLLILTCGVYADTVRMLTPLTASEMILNEGLDVLEAAILGN